MVPLISVIVVNYNGLRFLEPCLSSLISQTWTEFEIILVDNGSSDGSADYIMQHFPSVTLVETGKNTGFAGGANAGICKASGEYILTLNNDTVADPAFVQEILQPMLHDPCVGMCAAKMLFPDGRIYSTGINIFRNGAGVDRGIFEPDTGNYEREDEVFGPCAGAALYRRLMLDEVGLFDEDFFLYMEDVDLAFRARSSGWGCRYVPSARVIHVYGGTAGVESDLSVYYGNRNSLWCIIKNFPARLILGACPWILWKNLADIPFYFFQGKGQTILRAKLDAVKGFPGMLEKRRGIQRTVPDTEISKWIQK